ncbi:MAG TPA: tetratricopeptide repeat protein [Bryobacteraceae bacterium]
MAQKRVDAIWLLVLSFAPCAGAQESALRHAARLDAEQKCSEAEGFYRQALSEGTPSLALLNNLGNHYVLCADPDKAATYFDRVLKLNPRHPNANLQLARIAADRHQGTRALEYLARVSNPDPASRMLRAEALHWSGKPAEALAALDGVQKEAAADPRLEYLYGITCAHIGAYDRAETAFNAVLVQHPDDFDVLFNLGRAAARAKHYDRALHALDVAAKLRPDHVDSLLELGDVNTALGDYARAIYVLAQARRLAPERSEISLALAHAAERGEYYGDAAVAYDDYLKLKPGDDAARRDRALVSGFTGTRLAEGLKELAWYIQKHPDDPLGHYNLAQLTWRDRPQEALDHLTATLRLDPRLAPAHVDLAWLLNRQGRTAEAVPHFQKAIEINPRDARALDQLGSAYISLDRPADAEKVLRQAAAISPGDPEIMMHLGRALMETGHEEEGRQLLVKFQTNRSVRVRGPWKQPGMIESASLSAGERSRREIERLRQDAGTHPDDPELQLRLASLLLTEGRAAEANTEFRVLLTRNAPTRTWQQAGSFLLGFEQYQLAREFLDRAAADSPAANLDLATAIFHLEGPAKALTTLELVPEPQRSGDYLLLRARILDAAGEPAEAEKVLDQGLRLSISGPQPAREAALLLLRHNRKEQALEFLTKAAGNNSDLLLTRAMVLAVMERTGDSEKALKEIESQWPEWDRPYLVHALLLERTQPREAQRKLQTAVALGSQDLAALCASARWTPGAAPDSRCSCAGGIYELLFPRCTQP